MLVFAFSSTMLGYSLMVDGYADSDIDYQNYGVGSIYLNAMSSAMSAWNNAYCDCTVSSSAGSYNPLVTFTSGGTVYGFYQILAQSDADPYHKTTWFRIGMNSDLFPSMSTNARKSTCVHELGHAMGLNDLTSGTAIMNVNRNRDSIYNPQSDDINGVNASW
jgi:hypothetical protein